MTDTQSPADVIRHVDRQTSLRCLKDGRFMTRLTPTGRWWTCTCGRIRSSDPGVEFGLSLMRAAGWWA